MRVCPLKIICLLLFYSIHFKTSAQDGLKKGENVPHLPVKKLLDGNSSTADFTNLNNKLTIIDFFGTWCMPCLRALPNIKSIQDTFKNEINILLVSNETEAQLTQFINSRSGFPFRIIVDEDNKWNETFRPPSLPYTVIIKNDKVMEITEAESITADAIRKWLTAPAVIMQTGVDTQFQETNLTTMNTMQRSGNSMVAISQDYIYAAKTGDTLAALSVKLKTLSYAELTDNLKNDNEKKAFWINLYNGFTQYSLKTHPEQYKSRNIFFRKKSIDVANEKYSLDDIEHGILRHSKIKWSLGYLNKIFPSKKEKMLRVDKLDYRIHFALNCGAKSCPPIAFYNDEKLDAQLDLATKAFLSGEADYDSGKHIIYLPKLMSWFRADFGGKKGLIKILRQHKIIPADASPAIRFKDYDWTLTLNNYIKQTP
ncbi:MAG: DUF547 domain-containing protein [Ginsengibacter sp.]